MEGKYPNLFHYTIEEEKGIIDCHERGKNTYVKIGNQFNEIADQIEKITDQFLDNSNDSRVNKKQQRPIRMPIEDDEQSPSSNVDCTNTQPDQIRKRSCLQ
ncbi:hypothetical protein [Candidatus Mesenet endosymbiont of Agriotes lineatus]|uniref:hypothetical protein n=1 Tax=Candidatus Mesenet endosymbiont of Agriotes lineatus TaxID=3077948 RepID=UPI0030CFC6C4